jgi:Bacterial Ig-like domain (group 2)./Fibronectin type III domain.
MLPGVEIPQDVGIIKESAFASCSALSTVIIPKSVTDIEMAAFADCDSLKEVYYTGTEEDWKNNVWISPNTNDVILNAEKHYQFAPSDIKDAKVTLEQTEYPYDGTDKTPAVTVELNGKTLVLNMDYIVSYKDNTHPGTATVTVTGKVGYTGSQTKTFRITGDDENNSGGGTDGSGSDGNGNGSGGNPGGSDGTPGGNGGIPGGNDGTPGGSGGNSGGGSDSGTGGNTVSRGNLSKATIKLSQTSYTYDGKAKTPAATVVLNGKTLVSSTDYTVSYSDNIKVGTAKVTVTGKGNYTGSKTATFTITKASNQASTSITCKKTVYKVVYGTKPFKINASSKSKMAFTSSKPKIASVKKGTGVVTIKNTGIATITIKAGNVSKKVTIKVSPKKQSVKSVKAVKGKKLTVKWAKDKMASGYQVQVSTDKKFKKNVKSKSLSKTSYTFTKLKAGKKYYVRIRSFKKSGKETLNGSWSKVKLSSKVKK